MVSVVQDITDQKLFAEQMSLQVARRTRQLEDAQQQLTSYNTYLQKIINVFTTALQVLEPVIINDDVVDFTYKLTNEAYAAYTGQSPQQLTGKRVSELFPGYFDTDSFKNIRQVAITGLPMIWENHYPADGLDIYNEMGAIKFDGDVIVHLTDFTNLKRLQLDLEKNVVELQRSNENLGEFAHAASHDLKEPIRKIQIFTAQLRDQLNTQLTETQRRSFDRIERASRRMGQLVEDLLMFSHVSERPHEMEVVELTEIIAQVLEDLELNINEKKAMIKVAKLPEVKGYKRQLQQLFQNLISNAIKYSKPGVPPVIHISAAYEWFNGQQYQRIDVRDNGIGFDNEYREKIFQMFTRLHNKNEYSGTGVGLSIVKKVVDHHQGLIRAEGKINEGALFQLLLPVAAD